MERQTIFQMLREEDNNYNYTSPPSSTLAISVAATISLFPYMCSRDEMAVILEKDSFLKGRLLRLLI